ncbi:MAG TPA: hypothetical protein VNO55_23025 [Polyangia bacterium]|nr:hypothetical protein [Polyangia bacterium]
MIVAGLLLAFSGLSALLATAPQPSEKNCTKRGCDDHLLIHLRAGDGHPPNDVALEFNIDGQVVTCRPSAAGAGASAFQCGEGVTVLYQELQHCRHNVCQGTGSFEQTIEILSTPRKVLMTVTQSGRLLGKKTFVSRYTPYRPNGPGCNPICRQSEKTWRYR